MSLGCVVIAAGLFLHQAAESPGDRYIAQMTAAMQEGATPADVERVLALFTADAVYEHPAFGVRIDGIAAMRGGRLAQLGVTRHAHADIRGRTGLAGVEAVTLALSFEARTKDGWRRVTRAQLLLFEYRGGRIARLVEYWQT